MKLISLYIDSYKIFRNFDIDFCINQKPADIIVIAGVNGTGKTTLLKEILYEDRSGRLELTDGSRDTAFIYFPASTINLQNLTSSISVYIDRLVFEEGKTSIEGYANIREMIDTVFSDFELGTQFHGMDRNRQLQFTNKQGNIFGVDGLSDGEKQILGKVLPLFMDDLKGKIVLMDEPEESLHPSWQTLLVPVLRRCAKERECQFILATHSPQIISSVRTEELRILIRTADNEIKAVSCNEG